MRAFSARSSSATTRRRTLPTVLGHLDSGCVLTPRRWKSSWTRYSRSITCMCEKVSGWGYYWGMHIGAIL
jgi:hypothetical protein